MKKYLSFIYRVAGAVLMAFAVKNILEPEELLAGGFSGISIIAKEWYDIPLWVTNVVLNIPVFILAFFWLGKRFVAGSLITTAAFSVAVGLLPEWRIVEGDLFLSSILGGMLMGLGLGLILLTGASSGGVDMISLLAHQKNPRLNVAWVMFIIDAVIIVSGGVLFGWHKAIYSVVSVWLVSFVSEKIMSGPNYTKACLIVSEHSRQISERIMAELKRGITGINGRGMYTGKSELVLYCVASRHEMTKIRKIVYEVDSKAFMTMSDVSEVIGEGFVDW